MTQEIKIVGGVIIASVGILLGGVFFLGGTVDKEVEAVSVSSLITNESYKTSDTTGKVVITEFADFQCPACARTAPVLEKIVAEYEGKVSLVFRHFPLQQHKNAMSAAEAAEAVGALGGSEKFWEMYHSLYTYQTEWEESDNPSEFYMKYAKQLGIDPEKLKESVEKEAFRDKIRDDYQEGIRLGVNSTPTIFINNVKLTDAPTYENIKAEIEEELAGEI